MSVLEALLKIKQQRIAVSFNMLYAIEGAVANTHWIRRNHAAREALPVEVDAIESGRSRGG